MLNWQIVIKATGSPIPGNRSEEEEISKSIDEYSDLLSYQNLKLENFLHLTVGAYFFKICSVFYEEFWAWESATLKWELNPWSESEAIDTT